MNLQTLYTEITQPSYDGLSYEEIASRLNLRETNTIPNPTPQENVLKTVTMMDVIETALMNDQTNTPALIAAFAPIADRFERDLEQRNNRAIAFYLTVYGSVLNAQAQAAIQALLEQTIPDPTWQETITLTLPSRADTLGLPSVTPIHVQSALHLHTPQQEESE